MGAECGKVTCCGLCVQRSNSGCCSLFEQSSGVGSREARLSPINGWQVRDRCLTACTLLYSALVSQLDVPVCNSSADVFSSWIQFVASRRSPSRHASEPSNMLLGNAAWVLERLKLHCKLTAPASAVVQFMADHEGPRNLA